MTVTEVKYAGIKHKQDALLRKALDGGVHLAPTTATALTLSTMFAVNGGLAALPAGWFDLGYIKSDGAKFSRSVKTSDISSWGSVTTTRSDITSDDVTCTFTAQETNIHTIGLFTGVAESAIATTPSANGAIEIDKPAVPISRFYRAVVFGIDEDTDGETVIARFMPRVKITAYADQVFADQDATIEYGVTLSAYIDDTLGYSEAAFFGGAGWLAKLTAMGFTAGP